MDVHRRVREHLGGRIKASLQQDWKERTEKVAAEVEGHIDAGQIKEAWHAIKGWYRKVEGRAPRPSLQSMENQTAGREELYARTPPTGAPLPINVDSTPVEDAVPGEEQIRARLKARLKNGRTGGASGIRAEDMSA